MRRLHSSAAATTAQFPLVGFAVPADVSGPGPHGRLGGNTTFALAVDRTESIGALRMLTKFVRRKQPAEAVLSYADGRLRIDLPGNGMTVRADGEWRGEVRVSGLFMVVLAKTLPAGDPLPLRVEGGRLFVAGQSAPCTVQAASVERIQLPLNASLVDVLRARLDHSDEEIARSGLTPLVQTAEEERDAAIAKAHDLLRKLNVRRADLRRLVDDSIGRPGR